MSKRTRNLLFVLAGVLVLVIVAVIAGRSKHGDPVAVRTKKLAYTSFTVKLPENGVVMYERAATIPVLVSGNIGQMFVESGSRVSGGELLATIYNPSIDYAAAGSRADYATAVANVQAAQAQDKNARVTYQAAVDTNKSQLDEAQRVYDADVVLFAQKAIPRNQLDSDRAKLDQARTAYDQAVQQLKLGAVTGFNGGSTQAAIAAAERARITNAQNQEQAAFLQVRAPFSGVIQSVATQPNDALRPLQAGDQVTAGQMLFTIAGGDRYIVRAQVDEQDVINVTLGQPVIVSGQDFPGKKIPGRIAAIAPIATKSTDATSTAKQVLTTIRLDRFPPFLRDGMTVDVDILTTDLPHAIVVPNDAIFKQDGKSYVYVVEGGTARKREIRTGRAGDTDTLVASGLAAGDIIVAQKSDGLSDGTKVTPLPSPSGSPSASPSST